MGSDYLSALKFDRRKLTVLHELKAHYEDLEDFKERRTMLEAAISDHLSYGDDEEGEDEFDQLP
ncbi:hypothetical protein [Phyllobacterium bourgognense]|uniref:hypothetical protein n=1 Tax=Phyllobacterium bourgognense TaxID=314236 RepID=UPI000DF46FAC|nr:hypothetical protein [Phyllobacterium bourgognense]